MQNLINRKSGNEVAKRDGGEGDTEEKPAC